MISRGPILLAFSGLVILGLVVFRERQVAQWRLEAPRRTLVPRQLAPRFHVADHRRHVVKFERLLGRHRVVLLFFDATLGAEHDPTLQKLIECFPAIRRAGIEALAISDAPIYANQEAEKRRGEPFPFPLLTDIDLNIPASSPVHRMYGLFDERTQKTANGLFLIARDGTLPVDEHGVPIPVSDVDAALAALCAGEWPEAGR
jgi:Peroxiredoxin